MIDVSGFLRLIGVADSDVHYIFFGSSKKIEPENLIYSREKNFPAEFSTAIASHDCPALKNYNIINFSLLNENFFALIASVSENDIVTVLYKTANRGKFKLVGRMLLEFFSKDEGTLLKLESHDDNDNLAELREELSGIRLNGKYIENMFSISFRFFKISYGCFSANLSGNSKILVDSAQNYVNGKVTLPSGRFATEIQVLLQEVYLLEGFVTKIESDSRFARNYVQEFSKKYDCSISYFSKKIPGEKRRFGLLFLTSQDTSYEELGKFGAYINLLWPSVVFSAFSSKFKFRFSYLFFWKKIKQSLFGYSSYFIFLSIIVISLLYLKVDYHIPAKGRVEPSQLAAIAAPFSATAVSANFNVGDFVQAGDVLIQLDTNDLDLQKLELTKELIQMNKEFMLASASGKYVDAQVMRDRVDVTSAKLKQIENRIERSVITANQNGLIIKGKASDISGKSLGAGEPLYSIATGESSRIILYASEKEYQYLNDVDYALGDFSYAGISEIELKLLSVVPFSEPDASGSFKVPVVAESLASQDLLLGSDLDATFYVKDVVLYQAVFRYCKRLWYKFNKNY